MGMEAWRQKPAYSATADAKPWQTPGASRGNKWFALILQLINNIIGFEIYKLSDTKLYRLLIPLYTFNIQIIIIIFYFGNVVFFQAKLGSDVCSRVDNQPSGDTQQDLTKPLNGKIAISQLFTHGYIGASVWWWDALPTPTSSD